MRIILASSSPRRKEILKLVGFKNFETLPPKVKEIKVETPFSVKLNSIKKARSAEERIKPFKGETLIIASDTAVFIKGLFLGKPKDPQEAKLMLQTLSGNWHIVYTSISVIYRKGNLRREKTNLDRARVKFKKLTLKEIEWYISTGEPLDKAGAYGIQGYGALFVEKIVGDYFTIMGMSPNRLYNLLGELLGKEKVLKILGG